MTDTPQDQPLWRVIENYEAFMAVNGPLRRRLIALLIRAVADWLVPAAWLAEESKRGEFADFRVRKWIRQRLLAEADLAERGDG